MIEIEHPCLRPATITVRDSQTANPYYYQEGGINFYSDNFQVYPPVCNITFECVSTEKIVGGKDDDVRCDDPDAVTFDPTTGLLNFETADIDKYSLGTYRFYMRGTVGLVDKITADYSFMMRLVNPCPTTVLRNKHDFPFVDMRYYLGYNAIQQPFNIEDLISMHSRVDCGPIEIEFIDMAGYPLDDQLFDVGISDDDKKSSQFIVKHQNNNETVGDYLIRYRATLKNYPKATPAILSTPFTVSIVELKQTNYIFNVAPEWLTVLEDQYLVLGNHLVY